MRPTVCTLVWSMNSSSGEMISLSVAFAMKHIHTHTQAHAAESSNRSLAYLLAGWLVGWLTGLPARLFACAQPKLDHSLLLILFIALIVSSAPSKFTVSVAQLLCVHICTLTRTQAKQRAVRLTPEHCTQISTYKHTTYVYIHIKMRVRIDRKCD